MPFWEWLARLQHIPPSGHAASGVKGGFLSAVFHLPKRESGIMLQDNVAPSKLFSSFDMCVSFSSSFHSSLSFLYMTFWDTKELHPATRCKWMQMSIQPYVDLWTLPRLLGVLIHISPDSSKHLTCHAFHHVMASTTTNEWKRSGRTSAINLYHLEQFSFPLPCFVQLTPFAQQQLVS